MITYCGRCCRNRTTQTKDEGALLLVVALLLDSGNPLLSTLML